MQIINKVFAVTTDIATVLEGQRTGPGNQHFFAFENIGQMVTNVVTIALSISAILVLLFIIWGALDLISSRGDKQQYESARNKITYAVVGLAIVAVAWAGWWYMLKFFGIGKFIDATKTKPATIKFDIPTPKP